ncbi:Uncharacterized protein dnm_025380 [Desulfonema magnum]|uniref:Uncharacterized protein n=1 Tax=Desulfonema magnum TaxID=45655 RepID=A0A975BJY0_9BACT|nr:Uncharacterized protein dnm_025380 [Desulfonema magnum]
MRKSNRLRKFIIIPFEIRRLITSVGYSFLLREPVFNNSSLIDT